MRILILAALAGLSGSAAQAVNLVANGDFDLSTNGVGQLKTGAGGTIVTNWTKTGNLAWLLSPATDDVGVPYGGSMFSIWGPSNGSNNGLTASPTGGNYLAADGGGNFAAGVKQTINGLTAGHSYNVEFDHAAGQQHGFTGATTEAWRVSLGTQNFTTVPQLTASHGFSPWLHQKFVFTATSASAVLEFFAVGTPAGVPPISFLDNVTLTAVPEPATWALMLGGFAMVGFAARRRRSSVAA